MWYNKLDIETIKVKVDCPCLNGQKNELLYSFSFLIVLISSVFVIYSYTILMYYSTKIRTSAPLYSRIKMDSFFKVTQTIDLDVLMVMYCFDKIFKRKGVYSIDFDKKVEK